MGGHINLAAAKGVRTESSSITHENKQNITSKWKKLFGVEQGSRILRVSSIGTQANTGTMCDFHNFGLISGGQMHCLPQRLKSTLFEIFSNGGCPKGT